jgi:putative ABC transport system permease protein
MLTYNFISTVQLGIKNLLLHKLRSGLTILGIIFGVCSVISMLAIGEGASYEAQEAIKKLGSNNIILRSLKPPANQSDTGGSRSFELEYGLTYEDGSRIQATIPGINFVLPMRMIRDKVRFGENFAACQIIGTKPFYPEIVAMEMLAGRFLTETDEKNRNNVCVVTLSVARKLFPYQNPLDHSIKIGSTYYRVVGIGRETNTPEQRTQSGNSDGETLDQFVYIPLATARARFGETIIRGQFPSLEFEKVQLHEIRVNMADTAAVEAADPQIKTLLERFHKEADFEMIVPLQLLRQAEETKRIFNIVLGSIAAISLLVGGIGIMNIMLATVTERTREIGGAPRARRQKARHHPPVPRRNHRSVDRRRFDRRRCRNPRAGDGFASGRHENHRHPLVGASGFRHLRCHRHPVRHLPGFNRCGTRPHRSAPPRMIAT